MNQSVRAVLVLAALLGFSVGHSYADRLVEAPLVLEFWTTDHDGPGPIAPVQFAVGKACPAGTKPVEDTALEEPSLLCGSDVVIRVSRDGGKRTAMPLLYKMENGSLKTFIMLQAATTYVPVYEIEADPFRVADMTYKVAGVLDIAFGPGGKVKIYRHLKGNPFPAEVRPNEAVVKYLEVVETPVQRAGL